MTTATAEERRKQVVLGELPSDFLRVASTSDGATQLRSDEQAARALQHALDGYAASFVPHNARGRLSVTVVSAKLVRNYGLVRMDPYCRLRVGNTVFETPTDVSGGKSPKWHRTVHCYLPNGVNSIYVEIFDERAFTTDERVAWAQVTVPESVLNMDTVDDWYPLSGKEGDAKEGMLNLILGFAPLDAPPLTYVPMAAPPAQVVVVPGAQPGAVVIGGQPAPPVGQPGPPAGPLYSEDDVNELAEMFPAVDAEVVKSVLDEKRGNKDAAVNALLAISED